MGNTFEVWSWEDVSMPDEVEHLSYVQKYAGEDYDAAIDCMVELKTSGAACVKLEWR